MRPQSAFDRLVLLSDWEREGHMITVYPCQVATEMAERDGISLKEAEMTCWVRDRVAHEKCLSLRRRNPVTETSHFALIPDYLRPRLGMYTRIVYKPCRAAIRRARVEDISLAEAEALCWAEDRKAHHGHIGLRRQEEDDDASMERGRNRHKTLEYLYHLQIIRATPPMSEKTDPGLPEKEIIARKSGHNQPTITMRCRVRLDCHERERLVFDEFAWPELDRMRCAHGIGLRWECEDCRGLFDTL